MYIYHTQDYFLSSKKQLFSQIAKSNCSHGFTYTLGKTNVNAQLLCYTYLCLFGASRATVRHLTSGGFRSISLLGFQLYVLCCCSWWLSLSLALLPLSKLHLLFISFFILSNSSISYQLHESLLCAFFDDCFSKEVILFLFFISARVLGI